MCDNTSNGKGDTPHGDTKFECNCMGEYIAHCKDYPHGTEIDEYCSICGQYHWEGYVLYGDFLENINDGDFIVNIHGKNYKWINNERNYSEE